MKHDRRILKVGDHDTPRKPSPGLPRLIAIAAAAAIVMLLSAPAIPAETEAPGQMSVPPGAAANAKDAAFKAVHQVESAAREASEAARLAAKQAQVTAGKVSNS